MIIDINLSIQYIKYIEENRKIFVITKYVLDMIPKAPTIQKKLINWTILKLKNTCSQIYFQKMKIQAPGQEKMFAKYLSYKRTYRHNIKRT